MHFSGFLLLVAPLSLVVEGRHQPRNEPASSPPDLTRGLLVMMANYSARSCGIAQLSWEARHTSRQRRALASARHHSETQASGFGITFRNAVDCALHARLGLGGFREARLVCPVWSWGHVRPNDNGSVANPRSYGQTAAPPMPVCSRTGGSNGCRRSVRLAPAAMLPPYTARSMMVGQFLMLAGACQFGHGVGGFMINAIHSPAVVLALKPRQCRGFSQNPRSDLRDC